MAFFFLFMDGIMFLPNGFAQGWGVREKLRERVKERITQRAQGDSQKAGKVYPLIEGEYASYEQSPYGAGDYRRYLQCDGRKRFYEIHIPHGYHKEEAIPVVLNFHGGGGNPAQQRKDSQMDSVSDVNNFIVVYPAGTGKLQERFLTYNAGVCCGYAKENNIDDVSFTEAILDDLAAFFHIDQGRIYATGFSNGAFMCYRLAFQLADRIAAIAPVSGVIGVDMSQYKPARSVSVIHFHGLKDMHVAYNGGVGQKAQEKIPRLSVAESIQYWIKYNGCSLEQPEEFRKNAAIRTSYGSGKDGSEVVLWTLEDGGHAWPGGKSTLPEQMVGKLNRDISASELIWEFFQKHSL